MNIPTNEPIKMRAGVQWEWRREDLAGDFAADNGWTLKYWFKKTGSAGANFSIDATASGKFFAVTVLAAVTSAYTPGDYTWTALVTKAGEIREVDCGKFTIQPRYDQASNLDDRSHASKVLDAIKAVLEARATPTQRELVGFTIGSRSQQFDQGETKLLLLQFKSKYEWLVFDEEARAAVARGEPNPRFIGVRFDPS